MEQEYMDIYDDMDEDHKSKCRLCAREEKSKFLVNIFGRDGRKYALDIKIRKCLPFSVCEDDGMPKGVCLSCVNKLEVSSAFVESCIRANHTFMSVMIIDPASAKEERLSEEEEDEISVNDLVSDAANEDSSEAETVQHEEEDLELPVVIKDEPMDLEDEPAPAADKPLKSSSLQSVACHENTKEMDSMSNIILPAINAVPESPSVNTATVLQSVERQCPSDAPIEQQAGSSTGQEATKTAGGLQERLLEETELVIKDEPLGSPPQVHSPVTSDVEPLLEPPDQQTAPRNFAAPPGNISIEESTKTQDGVRDCSICNQSFPENVFMAHYQEHFNRKPDFSCPKCGKGFYTEAGFLAHKICTA